jgi:hypothetical protein
VLVYGTKLYFLIPGDDFYQHISRWFGQIFQWQILLVFIEHLTEKIILKIKCQYFLPHRFRHFLVISSLSG